MSGNMVRLRPADAAAAYKSYLRRLSDMLDDTDYLLGAFPSVADFAGYHPLWFTRKRTPSMAGILQLDARRGRLDGPHGGHRPRHDGDLRCRAGDRGGCRIDRRHTLLADSTFQDEHGIALGARVTVTPESFGPEPTEGELVAATRTHYTLRAQRRARRHGACAFPAHRVCAEGADT